MDRELDSDGDCLSDREEQSRIWEGGFLPGRILTSEVVVPEPPPFIHDVELADLDGDLDLMTSSPARRAFVWFPQLEDPLVFGSERVIPYNLNTNTGSGVQLIRWADIYLTQIAARATGASTRIQTGTWVAYCEELNGLAQRRKCMEGVVGRGYFKWGAQHTPGNITDCKKFYDKEQQSQCVAMMIVLTVFQNKDESL